MPSQLDIVQDGHSFEKFDILEGTGNTPFCNSVGGDFGDIFPLINDATLLGIVKSADTVQNAGLARPIGTNNGKEFTLHEPGTDPAQCLHPSEGKGETLNLYDGLATQVHDLSVSPFIQIPWAFRGMGSIGNGSN